MLPMSLWETKDSNGSVCLKELLDNPNQFKSVVLTASISFCSTFDSAKNINSSFI